MPNAQMASAQTRSNVVICHTHTLYKQCMISPPSLGTCLYANITTSLVNTALSFGKGRIPQSCGVLPFLHFSIPCCTWFWIVQVRTLCLPNIVFGLTFEAEVLGQSGTIIQTFSGWAPLGFHGFRNDSLLGSMCSLSEIHAFLASIHSFKHSSAHTSPSDYKDCLLNEVGRQVSARSYEQALEMADP